MVERHRIHLLRGLVAVVGSLLAGCSGVAALQPGLQATLQHEHQPGCRDGVCEPHCPVRPGVQGFYRTQWRRWPEVQASGPSDDGAATPANAPRSIVPRPDEESSQTGLERLPPTESPAIPLRTAPRPSDTPMPAAPATPTPAAPATPAPATPPRSAPPADDDNLFSSPAAKARAGLVASTAAAARAGASSEQIRFTRRMVEMLLSEHDGGVRARIVEEAATFETSPARAIIQGAANDPDPRVRAAACNAWESRGGSDAVSFLASRATTDADLGVRLRAIRALGELRDQTAVAALIPLLDDPDPAVQTRVCLALGRVTGLALGDDPQRWRQWAVQPGSAEQPRWSIANPFRGLW